jgi:hypothetical protein
MIFTILKILLILSSCYWILNSAKRMQVIVTDKVDCDQWDDFVTRHPLGSIYHHSAWQDVIKATYGYQSLYHLLLDNSSNLQAAISSAFVKSRLTGNRVVSYPFSDTCDPLVQSSEELESLLEAMEKTRASSNARFMEVRFGRPHGFMDHFSKNREYVIHLLPLDREPEILFRSFHKSSIQRAIKKAEKQDLEILRGESEQDLKSFYRLHIMTRKKHGVPIQPFRFFRNLWKALAPKEMISLLLVRHQTKLVAGIITLRFGSRAQATTSLALLTKDFYISGPINCCCGWQFNRPRIEDV